MPLHMGSRADSDQDSDVSSDAGSDKGDRDLDPAVLETLVDDSEETSESQTNEDSDDISEDEDYPTIAWTGYNKRTPVLVFKADAIVLKKQEYKAIAEQYHMSFKLSKNECKILRQLLTSHGFSEAHPNSSDFNIMWTGAHIKPYVLRGMQDYQKINHFPRSYEITRKDRLFKNIQRMQQCKGFKNFDFIPLSFVVPGEFQEFCSIFVKDKGPWIVKPVASSRGRGVYLVNHPEQVPLDENVIVSKYIGNPLLVDGFKFDLRFYVLVTSYDPLIIYLYEEGLTRFATVRYEKGAKSLRNAFMHLTNYSVNKKNEDYVSNDNAEYEDYGNKWSLGAFLRYLRSQGKDTTALMMRIEDVIIKTLLSAELAVCTACKMFQPFKGNCFELYGFDILIDDNMRPWLLEVNLSPSLACDAPLDLKIKGNMVADMFSLVGMTLHDPITKKPNNSGYRSDSAANRARAPRPSSASIAKKTASTPGAGLNSEEIRIVRRAKEEYARRGGWVRIFPSPDSWELYSAFLQYPGNNNLTLWQQLYPERAKMVSGKPSTAAFSSNLARTKSVHLHSAQYPQLYISTQQFLEAKKLKDDALAQALERSLQYERRLFALGAKRKKRRKEARSSDSDHSAAAAPVVAQSDVSPIPARVGKGNRLSQGVLNTSGSSGERNLPIDNGPAKVQLSMKAVPRPQTKQDSDSGQSRNQHRVSMKRSTSVGDVRSPPASATLKATSQTQPHGSDEAQPASGDVSKTRSSSSDQSGTKPQDQLYNVVQQLESGVDMSKVQVRLVFTMYLTRIRQRLVYGTAPSHEVLCQEQLDLVLRFLKRAANNLRQPIEVKVPSQKLPLMERRRLLANVLGDFITVYNKDTEVLRHRVQCEIRAGMRGPHVNIMDERKFEDFLFKASENQLEEVLTTYTRINRSAAIFLGEKTVGKSADQPAAAKPPVQARDRLVVTREDKLQDSPGQPHTNTVENGDTDSGLGSSNLHRASSQSSYASAVTLYSSKLSRSRPSSANSTGSAAKAASSPNLYRHGRGSRPSSAAGPSPGSVNHEHREPPDGEDGSVISRDETLSMALQRLTVRQQQRQYSASRNPSLLIGNHEATSYQPLHASLQKPSYPTTGIPYRETQSSPESASTPALSDKFRGQNYESNHTNSHIMSRFEQEGSLSLQHGRPSTAGSRSGHASDFTRKHKSGSFHFESTPQQLGEHLHRQQSPQQLGEHLHRQHSDQGQLSLAASRAKHEVMVAEAHAQARATAADHQRFPKPPPDPATDKKPPAPRRMARVQVLDSIANASKPMDFYNGLKYDTYTGTTPKPRVVYSSSHNTGL